MRTTKIQNGRQGAPQSSTGLERGLPLGFGPLPPIYKKPAQYPSPGPTAGINILLHHFLIEGVLGLKTYLAKVDRSAQKPSGTPFSRPSWPFWGPLAAILDFAGGAAVGECPPRR